MNKKSNNVTPPGIVIKEDIILKEITISWLVIKNKLSNPLLVRLMMFLIPGFFAILLTVYEAIFNYQGTLHFIFCYIFSTPFLVSMYYALANQLNSTKITIKGDVIIYNHGPLPTHIEKGVVDIYKINKIEHTKPLSKKYHQHRLIAITKENDFELFSSADIDIIKFIHKKLQSYLKLDDKSELSFLDCLESFKIVLKANPEKKNQKEWLNENIIKLENRIEDLSDCEDFLSTIVKIDSSIINSNDWKNKFIAVNKSHIEDIYDAIDFAKLIIKYLSYKEEAKLILKEFENKIEDDRDLKELQKIILKLFDDQKWANQLNDKILILKKRRKKVIEIQKPYAIKALLINILIPGLGSLIVGEKKRGKTQLLLFGVGVPLSFIFIGIPIVILAWLSALSLSIKLIKSSK